MVPLMSDSLTVAGNDIVSGNLGVGIINAITGKLRLAARALRRVFRRAFATILNQDDILHWPRVYTTDWQAWLKRLGVRQLPQLNSVQIESGFQKIVARYENVPEDRTLYPLGITNDGCQPYLGFLILHAVGDGSVTLEDVVGFHETIRAKDLHGFQMGISYLNQPSWQQHFPKALQDDTSWNGLLDWLALEYRLPGYSSNNLPRPEWPEINQAARVQVVGHFGYPSGLEVAARAVVKSLEACGISVGQRQISASPKDPPREMKYRSLVKSDKSIVVMSPEPYFANWVDRAGVYVPMGHSTKAVWYWELEEVPLHWRELASVAHEIWAPTSFIQHALARVVAVPVVSMLPAVTLSEFTPLDRNHFGLARVGFFFLFIFDLASIMERKNPLGLIRAFKMAFPNQEDAWLVLKITRAEKYPEDMNRIRAEADDPRIILIQEDMPREKLLALMNLCDVYVSLHRSEGFGLTMAEAMLLGKPVIATAYSGNMDFMDEKTALLVPYKRVELDRDYPPYRRGNHWAQPDEGAAATFMRRLWQNPDEARALGEAGRRKASVLLSLEESGRRMMNRL